MISLTTAPQSYLRRFIHQLDGDVLLLFYFIALVRPWFWSLNDHAAWAITIPLAVIGWVFYVATKRENSWPSNSFWLIVSLPLLFAYALRFPFPDTSFDVWSLRLFHSERALHGFLYKPSEFFPTSAPFNPTPDMITGLFRHLLGYRLGTVVNLFALLWSATIVEKMLRPVVNESRLRSCCVLLIVFVEHLLFEINNYMPDLLALPVLLEATRLTIEKAEDYKQRDVVRVAFLIGVAVALKLSNAAVAIPLVLIWIWRELKTGSPRLIATTTAYSLAVTIPLLLPFSIWVYRLTGSPIFPLYNGVFRSPFYPPFNGWDDRWGGFGPLEILAWPVLIFFHPQRTAEISVYSGRLSLGFIVAVVCLLFARKLRGRIAQIAFIILLGAMLWSLTMGYIRYGLLLEVLSGLLLVMLSASCFHRLRSRRLRALLVGSVALLLIGQSVMAMTYVLRMEWSMRPTLFDGFKTYRSQLRNVLHDYSLRASLPQHETTLFDQVDVWVVSGSKTAGLMVLLNDRPSFVGVRSAGLFLAPVTRNVFLQKINGFGNQRLFSLALHEDFPEAVFALRQAGLGIGKIETVTIPFYSKSDDLVQASFFDVTKEFLERPLPERTSPTIAFTSEALIADISPLSPPSTLKPSEVLDLYVRVKNMGKEKWPSLAGAHQKNRLQVAGRWLKGTEQQGSEVATALPYDLPPGETTVVLIRFRAPATPGNYSLEIDMNEEGISRSTSAMANVMRIKVE